MGCYCPQAIQDKALLFKDLGLGTEERRLWHLGGGCWWRWWDANAQWHSQSWSTVRSTGIPVPGSSLDMGDVSDIITVTFVGKSALW